MEKVEISYRTNFFSDVKTLVFTDKELSLRSKNKVLVKIGEDEIKNIRCGIEWISGIEITIGRVYCIDISDGTDKILQIRLRSIYGYNKIILGEKFAQIIELLYAFYFDNKISKFVAEIESGSNIEIKDTTFNNRGIILDSRKPNGMVEWSDLNIVEYSHYFALSSKKNPRFYKAFEYLTDWNAVLIHSISSKIKYQHESDISQSASINV